MMKCCIRNSRPAQSSATSPLNENSICTKHCIHKLNMDVFSQQKSPPWGRLSWRYPGTAQQRSCINNQISLTSPTWNRPILRTPAPAVVAIALLSPPQDAEAKEKENTIKKKMSNELFELQPSLFTYFKLNYHLTPNRPLDSWNPISFFNFTI